MAIVAPLTKAQSYISGLFRSAERADHDLRFYAAASDAEGQRAGMCQGASSSKGPAQERAWLCEAIPVHALVLAPSSARLKAQMDNPGWQGEAAQEEGPPASGGSAPKRHKKAAAAQQPAAGVRAGRPLLAVPLEGAHELEPALEVVAHCYSGRLTSSSVAGLLMVYKLSQYLLAEYCQEACCAALLAAAAPAAAPQLAAADALRVVTSPHLAFAQLDDKLQPVLAKCWQAAVSALDTAAPPPAVSDDDRALLLDALRARFGSTLDVVRSPDLLAAWLALPAAALEALLAPGRLAVDCEESVVVLLHCWMEKQHRGAVQAVKGRLRGLVRPLSLGPAYLQHILPRLPCFELTPSEAADVMFAALSASKLTGGPVAAALKQQLARDVRTFAAYPQWLEPRSCSAAGSSAAARLSPATLEWQLPRAQLEQLLVEARALHAQQLARLYYPGANYANPAASERRTLGSLTSPTAANTPYLGGFVWRLRLDVGVRPGSAVAPGARRPGGPQHVASAGLYLECLWPPCLGLGRMDPLGGVLCSGKLQQLQVGGGHAAKEVALAPTHLTPAAVQGAYGSPQFLMEDGALEMASWEKLLHGSDCLHLSATINQL